MRWATTWRRSTSAPVARRRRSRPAPGTPARSSTTARSSVGGRTARVNSLRVTRRHEVTARARWATTSTRPTSCRTRSRSPPDSSTRARSSAAASSTAGARTCSANSARRTRPTGATAHSMLVVPIDLGTGRTAVAIAAGGYHSCAVLDDGTAKCWGANGSGNLGQGDTTTRGDGAGEMGDGLDAIDLGTGRTAITVGRRAGAHVRGTRRRHRQVLGSRTPSGSSVASTPATWATVPARWATASPPSTSAPAAPPRRSPAGPTTRARCWTAGPCGVGVATARASSDRATPSPEVTTSPRWPSSSPCDSPVTHTCHRSSTCRCHRPMSRQSPASRRQR